MEESTYIKHLLLSVRVTNFVLPIIAVFVTLCRLYDRVRRNLLWWDDLWAALSMTIIVVLMASIEMFLEPPNKFPQHVKVSIYYMLAQLFYLVSWLAKISILFTVIRLVPWGSARKLLLLAAIAFGVTWAILFAQVWWVCEREPGWKQAPAQVQCDLGRNVAIAQVITDVLSDTILVVAPIRLVWKVRLSKSQKIRIIAIFSTTLLTTAVSLNHAYWVLVVGGPQEVLAAVIQSSMSLIVANLSVVISMIFRLSADELESKPEPLEMHSIVTFGNSNRGKVRKANHVNVLTTTVILSDDTTLENPTTIKLDDLDSNGQCSTGKTFSASRPSRGSDITGTECLDKHV